MALRSGLAIAALVMVATTVRAEVPFVGRVPLEVSDEARKPGGPPRVLRIAFTLNSPFPVDRLRARVARRFPGSRRDGEALVIPIEPYPPDASEPVPDQRKATFYVDFDQPIFDEVARSVEARFGAAPKPEQLRDFVFDYIANKNLAHGRITASKVARLKEGDCTEHATLLVALLRRYHHAARLAQGVALVREGNVMGTFGHEWAELYRDGKWVPLDATIPPGAAPLQLVPLSFVENEGMGGMRDTPLMAISGFRLETAGPTR